MITVSRRRHKGVYNRFVALDPDLVAPGRTAILVSECQRMVVGDRSSLAAIVEAATPVLPVIGRLVEGGRRAGVQIVHGTAGRRDDGKGAGRTTRFAGRNERERRQGVAFDPAGLEIVPEIGVDGSDIVISRLHGMTPMTETGLDPVLRNLGVSTIVATGVSLNVALAGTVIGAVDRGSHGVLPTDAVIGIPPDYGRAMLENTYAMVARLTTTDELLSVWGQAG